MPKTAPSADRAEKKRKKKKARKATIEFRSKKGRLSLEVRFSKRARKGFRIF